MRHLTIKCFCLFLLLPTLSYANPKIMFIGNSYTEFHFEKNKSKIILNDLPELVRRLLNLKQNDVTTVIQYGKSLQQSITADVISEIKTNPPNFLILQEGRADKNVNADAMKQILSATRATHTQVFYLDRVSTKFTKQDIKLLNSEKKLCHSHSHCRVIENTPIAHNNLNSMLSNDGVHPKAVLTLINAVQIANQIRNTNEIHEKSKAMTLLTTLSKNQIRFGNELDDQSETIRCILKSKKPLAISVIASCTPIAVH